MTSRDRFTIRQIVEHVRRRPPEVDHTFVRFSDRIERFSRYHGLIGADFWEMPLRGVLWRQRFRERLHAGMGTRLVTLRHLFFGTRHDNGMISDETVFTHQRLSGDTPRKVMGIDP